MTNEVLNELNNVSSKLDDISSKIKVIEKGVDAIFFEKLEELSNDIRFIKTKLSRL